MAKNYNIVDAVKNCGKYKKPTGEGIRDDYINYEGPTEKKCDDRMLNILEAIDSSRDPKPTEDWECDGRNHQGGGSLGNVPTKLSDLENDLFYVKRKPILTINPEDFIPVYVKDEDGNDTEEIDIMYYKISPNFNWCKTPNDIGFEAIWRDEETGGSETYTHYGVGDGTDGGAVYAEGYGAGEGFLHCDDCGIQLAFGYNALNYEDIVSEDAFYVICFGNDPWFSEITIIKNDVKKVPIEYCDTSEIENEINALADEVWNL